MFNLIKTSRTELLEVPQLSFSAPFYTIYCEFLTLKTEHSPLHCSRAVGRHRQGHQRQSRRLQEVDGAQPLQAVRDLRGRVPVELQPEQQ